MVKRLLIFLMFICFWGFSFATSEVLDVEISEFVDQRVVYNPLNSEDGIWYDLHENQTFYNLTGYVKVENLNPERVTVSDIYVQILNTTQMSLPVFFQGRDGAFISSDPLSGELILHIPELEFGENSTWVYSVNVSNVRPSLNFSTSYSKTKVLAGGELEIFDVVENVFDNVSYQSQTDIFNVNITQRTLGVNFSGTVFNFTFNEDVGGDDFANVNYLSDQVQSWSVLGGRSLFKGASTNISYNVTVPGNIPTSDDYYMINSTIRYNLNSSVSHAVVGEIKGVGPAKLNFSKEIEKAAHPTDYGSNVTWKVLAEFSNLNNLSYNLTSVTLWVAERTGALDSGDPNTVDVDPISSENLNVTFNPFVEVNKTSSWSSQAWRFNYSDMPTPIVWQDVDFTLKDDDVQLVRREVSQNGNDYYIKELYLIIGYWLTIDKNVTDLGNDSYNVKVYVHNQGNQVTPAGSVVMIYDFIPRGFNLSSLLDVSVSPWYDTSVSNHSVSGSEYEGVLYRFALMPKNFLNCSFASGPVENENTTWSVDYNITGFGDYELRDVYVTGLDPIKVDGAGATESVVVSEVVDKFKGHEGIFAVAAGFLLLLVLLI